MAGLTPERLLRLKRVSALAASDDGQRLAFTAKQYNWAASRWTSQIWVHDRNAGTTRILTGSADDELFSDHSPAWMSDNRTVVFISDRAGNGQLWQMHVDDSEPSQLTYLPFPIESFRIHHGIQAIVFSMKVVAGSFDPLRATTVADSKIVKQKGHFFKYDRLFVRRWDQWLNGRVSKLFLLKLTKFGGKYAAVGSAQYLMAKADPDEECPVPPFGDSSHYDISPDGNEIAYCSHQYPNNSAQAWSTFVTIKLARLEFKPDYIVDTATLSSIPNDSQGYSSHPTYSLDGRYIAFLSMQRPGYEADWLRVGIYDRAHDHVIFLQNAPVSPSELIWAPECDSVVIAGLFEARKHAYKVPLEPGSEAVLIVSGGEVHNLVSLNSGTQTAIAYLKSAVNYPDRVYIGDDCIADPNESDMKAISIAALEEMWFDGANQDRVHSWLLKPAGFDPNRKWPLAMIIHGGPQGCISDSWHYRWNLGVFAGAGFGVLAVNFHGSTSFGQAFCDSIQGDWGGKPFNDIMLGLDAALKRYDWIDPERVSAIGASYGGFMINWINGHTNRFRCLVNHDGLFNCESMYYTTEELYFVEHDFNGTPWTSSKYSEFSPHRFVDQWETPTLVIHGGKDYRVVDGEGIATFTALQRKGVPSEFLYFPDEGHWVLNPHNSLVWHENVIEWLRKWLK